MPNPTSTPKKSGRLRPLAALLALGSGAALLAAAARQRRISFKGLSVLVTGGSRGLGLVLARQLADEGARLTLVARDEEELERARNDVAAVGAEVLTVRCDVRRREEVNEAVTRAVTQYGRIDVLINNAGILQAGPIDALTVADFEEAMAVNFFGPLHFTLAALPHLRAGGGGRIVNISSLGGRIAVPHLLPYTASKFALTGLSEGLRAELRREKILVTTACPGLMRTGSARNATFKGQYKKEYAWFLLSSTLPVVSMDAERAARQILGACRSGRARVVLGLPARAAVLLDEIAPGLAARLSSAANRVLPRAGQGGTEPRKGSDIEPHPWVAHMLEGAARRNNEMGG